ncbi:unnamed protein product, partial [Vitis vinifera]|uniref:Uncharacterized protein n=1 Tax=Vitis vinifera TaxID=29760 RepID=D7SX31_VITVI
MSTFRQMLTLSHKQPPQSICL